jgi:hypothetical protein
MKKDGDVDWRSLEQFSFGDNPRLAQELAELVLAGKKRATCWAASEGPKTHPGKQWVVRDGSGVPVAVIETTELTQRRFDEVDAAFAFRKARATARSPSGGGRIATISAGRGRLRRICWSIASASGWSRGSIPKVRSTSYRSRFDPSTT